MFKNKEMKRVIILQIVILLLTIFIFNILEVDKNIIIIMGMSLIIMDIIHYIYMKNQNSKIKQLSIYMMNILNNNYSLDIRDYEEGDISNLKNDIYKMTIKLKEQSELSIRDKKYLEDVLSDISHQLKTPLTSMYVINDVLLTDSKMKEEIKKDFLIKNRNQLERIEWLITTLLKMSRLDSGSEQLNIKKVKIGTLIEKAVAPLQIPIELKHQDLIIEYNKDIELNIDLNWTVEALINIIKNAHEHTKEEGTIKIKVEDTPIYTQIQVINNGEDINPKDIPYIFDRFYKGTLNKESIGIGLNMSKKIINLENGDIKVISKNNETSFYIKFYKNNL